MLDGIDDPILLVLNYTLTFHGDLAERAEREKGKTRSETTGREKTAAPYNIHTQCRKWEVGARGRHMSWEKNFAVCKNLQLTKLTLISPNKSFHLFIFPVLK